MKATITHSYIYSAALAALLTLCLSACGDADVSKYFSSSEYIEEQLSLSTDSITAPYGGATQTFTISNNTIWTCESGMADWLQLSQDSGEGNANVTITILANDDEFDRSTTLIFTTGTGMTVKLPVHQKAMERTLFIDRTGIGANAKDGSTSIVITGTSSWSISVDAASWVHFDKQKGQGDATIAITCDDNHSTEARTAIITISGSQNITPRVCTLVQSGATLPTVSETFILEALRYSATVSATYSSLFPVTEYGFCYSTDPEPTVEGVHKSFSGEGDGSIFYVMENLTSGLTYYVRAYAKSAVGLQYGKAESFSTAGLTPGEDDNGEPDI